MTKQTLTNLEANKRMTNIISYDKGYSQALADVKKIFKKLDMNGHMHTDKWLKMENWIENEIAKLNHSQQIIKLKSDSESLSKAEKSEKAADTMLKGEK